MFGNKKYMFKKEKKLNKFEVDYKKKYDKIPYNEEPESWKFKTRRVIGNLVYLGFVEMKKNILFLKIAE